MKSIKKIAWGVGVLLVLGVLWYLISPLFITQEVDEAFPSNTAVDSELDTAPQDKEEGEQETPSVTIPEPMLLTEGVFEDVDIIHKGTGRAAIYTLADGSRVLRLEDFEVTNGPELHVVLSVHERPRNQSETKQVGFVDLGDLKGNKGNQNYILPADLVLDEIKSVVIYCYPFNVVFSSATLQ